MKVPPRLVSKAFPRHRPFVDDAAHAALNKYRGRLELAVTKPSTNGRVLLIALRVNLVIGILLTPLGPFETRPISSLRSFAWPATFVIGMILNVASAIVVFSRARVVSIVAIAASILFIVPIFADQAGFFMSLPPPPPPPIPALEIATILISLLVIFYASNVYWESTTRARPS